MNQKTDEIDALAAAYLYDKKNTVEEIAHILSYAPATISRLLKKARADGYLVKEERFSEKELSDAEMEQVRQRAAHSRLRKRLGEIVIHNPGMRVPVLHEFPSGSKDDSSEGWDRRLLEFGRRAAPVVRQLLLQSTLCGVSWGATIGNVVYALPRVPVRPYRTADAVSVIPLCGEPLGNMPIRFSSSTLAAELEKYLTGNDRKALSLGMVPAFIPDGFSKAELDGVWKLIELVEAYQTILGKHDTAQQKQRPLVEQLDMVLTSVGPSDRLLGYGSSKLIQTGKLNREELQDLVFSDISGVLISRSGLSKADQAKLNRVNERWTGIRLEHLLDCAKRAATSDSKKKLPGVVVIAIGKSKAHFLLETIKLGLINHLILDYDLEEELERLVEKSIGVTHD